MTSRAGGPPPHPTEQLDPGVQSERTQLAWQRTGLGFAAVGALFLRIAYEGHLLVAVPGLLTLLAATLLTGRAHRRYRETFAAVRNGHSPADHRAVATTAALTALLGLTALAVILVV